MLKFKHYQTADKEPLLKLFKKDIPEYFAVKEIDLFSRFLDETNNETLPYFTVYKDSKVIGGGGLAFEINEKGSKFATLCWGFIDKDLQKNGYGKESVLFREDYSKKLGVEKMKCSTSQKTNLFFEKLGYVELFRESNHWGEGLDLVEMEKPLTL